MEIYFKLTDKVFLTKKGENIMKKIFRYFYFALFLFSICGCKNNFENKNIYKSDTSNLHNGTYILSNEISQDFIDFAKYKFDKDFIKSFILSDGDKISDKTFVLSEPFSLEKNSCSFLIMNDNKYICNLIVHKEGNNFAYNVSKGRFTDKLNNDLLSKNGIFKISFEEKENKPSEIVIEDLTNKNNFENKTLYNIKKEVKKVNLD